MAGTTAKTGNGGIEILSPAGSYDILKTAINAGADAVYAGGSCFGARAFAQNFTEKELLEAIDYVHLHGKKLYLTVNTLVKEREMENVFRYLLPFYKQGLDAVIVQDLGVMDMIRQRFPDLPIHASTQMTVTHSLMAGYLEELGVVRIVPARELSLTEIRKIADRTNLEIECFVHGALCYCYSGQCLLSSMIGGRSGNRGQCAQPCRLPWAIKGSSDNSQKEGRKTNEKSGDYLSLKDLCTIDLIPELIEAGITSFKIEGRMKQASYVKTVVEMYRKYVDLYLEQKASGTEKQFLVSKNDLDILQSAYQRRGYTDGYYRRHNGKEMLSLARPDARETLKKADTCNERELQEKINGKLILSEGKSAKLYLSVEGEYGRIETVSEGALVQKALKQPISEERLEHQLRKTGGTPFVFDKLSIEMDGDVFLPIQGVNELRRAALERLENEIVGTYRRDQKITEREEREGASAASGEEESSSKQSDDNSKERVPIYVSVETEEQLKCAARISFVERIYVEDTLYLGASNEKKEELKTEICQAQTAGKEVFFAMARIFRSEAEHIYRQSLKMLCSIADGMLIRNMESLRILRGEGYEGIIIADSSAYQWNRRSQYFWKTSGADGFVAPLELNVSELEELDRSRMELPVYGYAPVMVSAGCVRRHTSKCTKKSGWLSMSDRYQKEFAVKNECLYCYNVIYNTAPTLLADQGEEIEKLRPSALIFAFSRESSRQMSRILEWFSEVTEGQKDPGTWEGDFTRGHFKRGVK